ncbi:REP-associated tyrosine transposase [Pseudoduganella sp. HUAS MS19]
MSRPSRIQFQGALYHVTSRGNRRANIFLDHRDFLIWLDILAQVVKKHHIKIHGYCLMPNHFHIIIQTPEANLSQAMQMLNARYCQHFNKRHGTSGHVIQGRFHSILIEFNLQLLAVSRYVSLNPVRARLVANPSDWPWSNHRYFLTPESAPEWLETDWILGQFAQKGIASNKSKYEDFVLAGIGMPNPIQFHGQIPNTRREHALSLQEYADKYPNRTEAIARAHQSTAYTRQQIGEFFGVSPRTISRSIIAFPERNT